MKFRNYCIVVMGETDGVIKEITSIAEKGPNILDAKGILIATFMSNAEPSELTDFFKNMNRNFLIFDLNKDYSGFNILKEDISKGLFGFLDNLSEGFLKQKTEDLIQELTSSTIVHNFKNIKEKKPQKNKISLEDIDEMSSEEKEILLNKLLEKGPSKLSEYDKKILKKLAIN
jgi:hypothetical protein